MSEARTQTNGVEECLMNWVCETIIWNSNPCEGVGFDPCHRRGPKDSQGKSNPAALQSKINLAPPSEVDDQF